MEKKKLNLTSLKIKLGANLLGGKVLVLTQPNLYIMATSSPKIRIFAYNYGSNSFASNSHSLKKKDAC
jgi:hypothetical protein